MKRKAAHIHILLMTRMKMMKRVKERIPRLYSIPMTPPKIEETSYSI